MFLLSGLALLYKVPEYLTGSEKIGAVSEMSKIILNDSSSPDMRQYAIGALQRMSASDPDTYQKTTLELLTGRLPTSLSSAESERATQIDLITKSLNTLVQISCSMPCLKENDMGRPMYSSNSFWHRNFDATVFKLFHVLDEALKHEGQTPYLHAIIVTIVSKLPLPSHCRHRTC